MTRIDNRGFNFGIKSQEQAMSIVKAHPTGIFDITHDGKEFMAEYLSAVEYLSTVESEVRITLY